MIVSSILKYFYSFSDPFYKKNKNNLKDIVLIEPAKVIITSSLKTDDILKLNWLISKRLNLILTESNLYIGDMEINKEDIKNPNVTYFSSFFGLLKYQVLKFKVKNEFVFLGTNMSPNWFLFLKNIEKNRTINKNNYILLIMFIIALMIIVYSM